MFLYEAKQIPQKVLLLRPRSPVNSKKRLSTSDYVHAGAQLDAFQRAVIVFIIVFCRRRRRRRRRCLRSLITPSASCDKHDLINHE